MSDARVRSCPFCGSNNVEFRGYNHGRFFYCPDCQAETYFRKQELEYCMGLNPAIKDNALDNLFLDAWNQRKINGD